MNFPNSHPTLLPKDILQVGPLQWGRINITLQDFRHSNHSTRYRGATERVAGAMCAVGRNSAIVGRLAGMTSRQRAKIDALPKAQLRAPSIMGS